ncbi:hypothetical protein SAY86_029789 [Trapa natans]|uniref:TPX2 C-terminal domain-containing protein n=1 Tax=Trapa natans TaxID=22666 RepID=A0AAN7RHP7_TRANT|nr:hypothetical protein SAY86_029789 [Trapa natans]
MAEKKKAEAALLEQANAAACNASKMGDATDSCNSTSPNVDLEKTIEPNKEDSTQTSDSNPGAMLDGSKVQCKEVDDKDLEKEQSRLHDLEKSPLVSRVAKSKEGSYATPKSEATPRNSLDKKRSAHKWLKPLNFTPIKEINLLSSAARRKTESHPGAPKDCPTPFKTPIKVPDESSALATPMSDRRKSKNGGAAAESKTCTKRSSLATECSKFLNKCKNKLQSPMIPTPFRLRTEERAARRREKLEDKFNAEKAQNALPPRTQIKDIPETESRKWRPTFCFTAGPFPTDLKDMRRAEDLTKKVPAAPQPSNSGRKPQTRTVKNNTLPSKTIPSKSSGSKKFLGKTFQTTARPRAAEKASIALENTPPNIQQV